MPFIVARLHGSTRSDINWDFSDVLIKTFLQLVKTTSLVFASDISGFFSIITLFAKLPISSEESQTITRPEVTISFSFKLLGDITSISSEKFTFFAFFLTSTSDGSVLLCITTFLRTSGPWTSLPFRTAESITALLDFGSFSGAVVIVNSHSSAILVDFVAVDNSVLQSLVSTAFATLLPFTFEPFGFTVNSLAFLLDFRLSSVIFFAEVVRNTLLAGSIDTERSSGLDSLSASYGTLRPFPRLIEVGDILIKRDTEFVFNSTILRTSTTLEQDSYSNLIIERTFGSDSFGSIVLGLFVLETSSSSFNFLIEDLDLEVSVQEEEIARVLQGQRVRSGSHFFNLDGSGSSREDDNVMVARREISLIEETFNSLASRSISIANSTLVSFLFRAKLAIATKRKTDSINTDIVSSVVTLGSVNNFVSPLVVEVGVFGFAGKFALVLSSVGEPFVVVSIERIIIVLGTLFSAEIGSIFAWLNVTRQVTD